MTNGTLTCEKIGFVPSVVNNRFRNINDADNPLLHCETDQHTLVSSDNCMAKVAEKERRDRAAYRSDDHVAWGEEGSRRPTFFIRDSMAGQNTFASSSALHLSFPPAASGVFHSRSITGVKVHPPRVIGTLLGTRSENEVEIRNCFAVPHGESQDPWQIHLDAEHHRRMLDLHLRVCPEEVVLGWYSTNPELNANSALIQDHYSRETAPHQAIHLTLNTNVADEKNGLGVQCYVSALLGATWKAEDCVFISLPTTLLTTSPEQTALRFLSQEKREMLTDLDALKASLEQVQAQLERVLTYVRKVLSGELEGDKAVGRYLSDTISVVPAGLKGDELSALFNSHLQDVFMVSYLANMVSTQADLSARLALLQ